MFTDEVSRLSTLLKCSVACCAVASVLHALTPECAWAQAPTPVPAPAPATTAQGQANAPADGTDQEDEEEIIVTGTLIRNVAPTGSNVLEVSKEDIQLSGVVDSNALLATLVPQSEGFMDLLEPGRGSNLGITRVPVLRPSLRNLGDSFNGSGTLTLVLLDGGRIVPAGIEQSVVDVGIIPPRILERTEIILDGTSAVYGSDAVGGTINYIPRKRFDEIRLGATYGFADDYYTVSADATAGTSWEGGGIGLAYSFGKSSNILEGDRDYAIARNYLEGARLTQLACDGYGHISIGSGAAVRRFLSTTLQERTDWCDLGFATYTPAQERHSGFFVFSQDITSNIKFDVSAFYSERTTLTNFGPYTSSVTVRPGNPYYRPIVGVAGISPTANQTVAFQWGPIFGNDAFSSETFLKVAQVSPSITVDLGSDWQVRFLGAYGKSRSSVDQHNIDTLLVGSLAGGQAGFQTTANAINPYDITATVNKALFGNLRWHDLRDGKHTFYQARAVADGPLFSISGGDVRVALGVEWSKTDFKRRVTDATTHILGPFTNASASNKSVFGEVNVPLVSADNAMPGIASLTLSASARYDHYASFGGTFNPKFAATYQPVTWVTLRGNWGKSFRAPNAVDKLGSNANDIRCVGTALPGCTNFAVDLPPGAPPLAPNDTQLTLSGTNANLKPEKSTNWAIGADIQPPFIPGLTLSATHWSVKFSNAIGFPPIALNAVLAAAPQLITFCPCTPQQLADFAARAPNGQNALNIVAQNGYNIRYLRDNSITNLTAREVRGLDATMRYNRPTGFGSIDAFINGAWILRGRVQLGPSSPVTNEIATGTSNFRATAGIGATVGDFRAQVTMQHRAGFDATPAANRDPNQTHIPSYQIFNTSFRWNVDGGGLAKDLALTLVVNNIFNNAPPVNRTTAGTTTNGNTIGRVIQFGIEKAF